MVLPEQILEVYNKCDAKIFSTVPLMMQITLEKFLSEGHWEKHLRKIRTTNRKKHNLMKYFLIEKLGDSMKIESQGAGLSILINPYINIDIKKLKYLAKKERIKIYFVKKVSGGDWDALRMGFGLFNDEEIELAVEMFSRIWHKSIKA